MSGFPVGIQMFSVREELSSDFEGTIKSIAEMGYDGVEFPGLFGHTCAEIRDVCRKYGLDPVSTHSTFNELIGDPEGVVKDIASIGSRYIVITYLTEEYRPGGSRYQEVLDGIPVIGKTCAKYGIELLYHNHDFEFVKLDGEYLLDRLYKDIPAEFLKTQLDTCWINVGGEDPSFYIRKYKGRSPLIHLKDFVMPGKAPENCYERNKDVASVEAFQLRPVGFGVQNVEEIIRASRDAGSRWLIVEQDSPTPGLTSLECAKMSIDFLKQINV